MRLAQVSGKGKEPRLDGGVTVKQGVGTSRYWSPGTGATHRPGEGDQEEERR